MDKKYIGQEFWDTLSGCQVSIQGRGKKSVCFKASITNAVLKGVELKLFLKNVPDGQSDELKRSTVKMNITEADGRLGMIQENEYDVYITLPEVLDFRVPQSESSTEQVVEMVAGHLTPLMHNGKRWDEDFENIVLLRHGDYENVPNDESALTVSGREEVKAAIAEMKRQIVRSNILVFSSIARRGFESGFLVADSFDTVCFRNSCFGDRSGDRYDTEVAMDLIFERHRYMQTIIIASHLPFCEKFPRAFADKVFGTVFRNISIEKGEAIWIDLKRKHISKLLPLEIPV
jgi:phosphohistidine phosphatase SixA